jgi:hypothetical protein
MADKVFLVHGWSVDSTETYQALHVKLAEYGYELHDVNLARYVTLDDRVRIADLARGMDRAMVSVLGRPSWKGERFHIVTHSTGALVVRHWISDLYDGKRTEGRPLRNVVFLAGPHFGSRLAHHGRSMLAHVKWGGATGRRILDGLELGSDYAWDLNGRWLDSSSWKGKGVRPYCLIGASSKASLLARTILPGTAEKGSDGVVRLPSGNLNFRRVEVDLVRKRARSVGSIEGVPFGAIDGFTHSGASGIMASITTAANRRNHRPLDLLLRCLSVRSGAEYRALGEQLKRVTVKSRKTPGGFSQLDFHIRDVDGRGVEDFAILLGTVQESGIQPAPIVTHRHKNLVDRSRLTLFLDLSKLRTDRPLALKLTAETHTPLVEFGDDWNPIYPPSKIETILTPDQTTQVEVILDRRPDADLFVFHPGDAGVPDGQDRDGPPLHVRWNRQGVVTKTGIEWK